MSELWLICLVVFFGVCIVVVFFGSIQAESRQDLALEFCNSQGFDSIDTYVLDKYPRNCVKIQDFEIIRKRIDFLDGNYYWSD